MVTDVVVKAEIYIDNNNDKICTYIYSAKFKIKLARIAVISWAKFYGYVILCYWLCNLRHSYWWNILCNCRQRMLLAVREKSCQRFFKGHFLLFRMLSIKRDVILLYLFRFVHHHLTELVKVHGSGTVLIKLLNNTVQFLIYNRINFRWIKLE